ncbi:MAG: T9SS type A sorting domain-containing protein [Bacteroidia bacterium]|nr:T9SS type A sorting domain-containing protein [Bacteroidia bacterium]
MKKLLLTISAAFLASQFSIAQVPVTNDTVPVIVHVINLGEAYGVGTNLDSVQIYSQFKVLNADYAGQGFNVNTVPAVWAGNVANTGVVFVKALYDPQGNTLAEPGIERVSYTSLSGVPGPGAGWNATTIDNSIKPQTVWPASLYCNIWVLKLGGGLLGYATLPANSGLPWLPGTIPADSLKDGVVINYQFFGDTLNVQAPYNKGRTCTHELGHWFGLVHIGNCTTTPYCSDLYPGNYNMALGSPVFPDMADSCTGFPLGPMFMNFMSYVDDASMYMFTTCQSDSIVWSLHHSTYHNNLQNSWVYHTVPTSIKEMSTNDFISVYPNPSNGTFTFHRNGVLVNHFRVMDVNGREIKTDFVVAENKLTLLAPAGMYLLQVFTENGMVIKRLVVE